MKWTGPQLLKGMHYESNVSFQYARRSCIIEGQLWCRPKWTEKVGSQIHTSHPSCRQPRRVWACSGCGQGFRISAFGFLGRVLSFCLLGTLRKMAYPGSALALQLGTMWILLRTQLFHLLRGPLYHMASKGTHFQALYCAVANDFLVPTSTLLWSACPPTQKPLFGLEVEVWG